MGILGTYVGEYPTTSELYGLAFQVVTTCIQVSGACKMVEEEIALDFKD